MYVVPVLKNVFYEAHRRPPHNLPAVLWYSSTMIEPAGGTGGGRSADPYSTTTVVPDGTYLTSAYPTYADSTY